MMKCARGLETWILELVTLKVLPVMLPVTFKTDERMFAANTTLQLDMTTLMLEKLYPSAKPSATTKSTAELVTKLHRVSVTLHVEQLSPK